MQIEQTAAAIAGSQTCRLSQGCAVTSAKYTSSPRISSLTPKTCPLPSSAVTIRAATDLGHRGRLSVIGCGCHGPRVRRQPDDARWPQKCSAAPSGP